MKIAIIDSGIDNKYYKFQTNVKFECIVGENNEVKENLGNDEIGHGTLCADIILRYCPNAELYVYRIYDDTLVTSSKRLINALKLCKRNKVDIINLSLGMISKSNYDELYDICLDLTNRGVIIVASASESESILCWPAEFTFVVKVMGNQNIAKDEYCFYESKSLTVGTFNGREFAKGLNNQKSIIWGNSFACARMTGILGHQMSSYGGKLKKIDIYDFLYRNSVCTYKDPRGNYTQQKSMKNFLLGKEIIVFPYNKEMHSIIRFSSVLKCKIVAVVDFPFSRQVKKDVGKCIGLEQYGLNVESSFEKAMKLKSDTVLLGDLSEISSIRGKNYMELYALKAFKNKKNVVTIELLKECVYKKMKQLALEKGCSFISLNDYIKAKPDDKVPNIILDTPILCVLGTGPKVGKFSFQVSLNEYLRKIGYEVGMISTEMQGYLFDYPTMPLGNAILLTNVPFENQIEYLRWLIINTQQEKNRDILLLGGQSGVVPYNTEIHTDYNSLSSIIAIMAAKPDGFILCINPIDEIEYIKRTICSIESFGYGKVFLCILTNRIVNVELKNGIKYEKTSYLSKTEHIDICKKLSNKLKIPVMGFNDEEDIKQVIINIQDYYSERN